MAAFKAEKFDVGTIVHKVGASKGRGLTAGDKVRE